MNSGSSEDAESDVMRHEIAVLQMFGLRWAVLAAWRDALRFRHVDLDADVDTKLESARLRLVSGCFSTCEVGCFLSAVEGTLTSADASTQHNWVDFWLDLLAQSMSTGTETERILKVPAVKVHYLSCGIAGCTCES